MKSSASTNVFSLREQRPDEEMILDDLADLVPAPVLHQAQDAFSSAVRVPLLFISPEGEPLTQTSDLDTFCRQLTRQNGKKGPCASCSRLENILGLNDSRPFDCPMGLKDVVLPVNAGDMTVGYLATSLIAPETRTPIAPKAARDLGLGPESASEFVAHIPVEPAERILEIAESLSAMVKVVSELAFSARENKLARVRDQITGLASRAYFWDCLSRELERADAHNYPVTMMLIDLDDFKAINDTFGHETGDRILRSVGQVLKRELRTSDLAARYASDAFLAMLRCADPGGAEIVGWRLKTRIAACQIMARGQTVPLSASIGQVTYPVCAARDPDDLFKEAIAALRQAQSKTPTNGSMKAA